VPLEARPVDQAARQAADADATHPAIGEQTGPRHPARLTRQTRQRVVADEAARLADLVHALVAGVDALGAADALHLQAVADVDAGGADHHATLAIDAVAPLLGDRRAVDLGKRDPLGSPQLAPRLAPRRVVADDQ